MRQLFAVGFAVLIALSSGRDARALNFNTKFTFDPSVTPSAQQQYQQAMAQALGTLATFFQPSNITLGIDATFKDLGGGDAATLGQGGPSAFSQINNTGSFYAQPLYDFLTGTDVSGQTLTINVTFSTNSSVNWDFSQSTPGQGQSSFQDVVMHEVGHAMGFIDTVDQNGALGQGGPSIFEDMSVYVTNGMARTLSSLTDAERQTAITSNSIFWNGQYATAANAGNRVQLYAPNPYEEGSTYSHIDPSQTGKAGLFFPSLADATYFPGLTDAEKGIFHDIGWATTGAPTPAPTATPSATPQPTPTNIQFVNISTRLVIGSADQVGIGGFILRGSLAKRVIVRAIGPSLTAKGVNGALADPFLELHGDGGTLIADNDNWRSLQEQEIAASGVAPTDDREAAIVATLDPGKSYTAILKGVNNATGVGLIEVYDLNPNSGSDLANISTRGNVLTGENILIGGLIIQGGATQPVAVRAIGPSLGDAGVQGTLVDPTLDVRDANGASVMTNDNWQDDPAQATALQQNNIAPTRAEESAIIAQFPAGRYTALVQGKNGGTGIALVEAYNIGPGNSTTLRSDVMMDSATEENDPPPEGRYLP